MTEKNPHLSRNIGIAVVLIIVLVIAGVTAYHFESQLISSSLTSAPTPTTAPTTTPTATPTPSYSLVNWQIQVFYSIPYSTIASWNSTFASIPYSSTEGAWNLTLSIYNESSNGMSSTIENYSFTQSGNFTWTGTSTLLIVSFKGNGVTTPTFTNYPMIEIYGNETVLAYQESSYSTTLNAQTIRFTPTTTNLPVANWAIQVFYYLNPATLSSGSLFYPPSCSLDISLSNTTLSTTCAVFESNTIADNFTWIGTSPSNIMSFSFYGTAMNIVNVYRNGSLIGSYNLELGDHYVIEQYTAS